MSDISSTWVESLPTLDCLPTPRVSSLIRPFSLFSLFRSTPSLPSTQLLDNLRALLDHDSATPANLPPLLTALGGLQSFVTQLKAYASAGGAKQAGDWRGPESRALLAALAEGYLQGFYLSSTASLDITSISQQQEDTTQVNQLREAAAQCLEGFFTARPHLEVEERQGLDLHILGAMFHSDTATHTSTTMTAHHRAHLEGSLVQKRSRLLEHDGYLTPVFALPRRLIAQIQHAQPARPIHNSKTRLSTRSTRAASIMSPVKPAPQSPIHHQSPIVLDLRRLSEVATDLDTLLSSFIDHMDSVEELSLSEEHDTVSTRAKAGLSPRRSPPNRPGRGGKHSSSVQDSDHLDSVGVSSRISIEAQVLRCDLAMTMAAEDMVRIKARARARYGYDHEVIELSSDEEDEEDKKELGSRRHSIRQSLDVKPDLRRKPYAKKAVRESDDDDEEDEDHEEAETKGPGSEDEEADVKPVINQELETKPNIQQVDEPSPAVKEKIDLEAGPHWEDIASIALIDALDSARHLMEAKRGDVLVDRINREDWLPEIKAAEESGSSESPPVQHDSKHRRAVQVVLDSPSKRLADESPAEESSEVSTSSEEDFHTSDSEHSSEQESNTEDPRESSTTSGLVPLKALFTLHARYEESRLAVWLDIPKASRGKMAAFMRGHNPPLPQAENDGQEEEEQTMNTDRYVGEVWDELGLLLLMPYDNRTLLHFGLEPDKLDKWIELASSRNSKRSRGRGGRGGRARGRGRGGLGRGDRGKG